MSRSLKKGPYVDAKLLRRVEDMNESGKKTVIKSWARSSSITPEMVGHTIAVHNGRIHAAKRPVSVTHILTTARKSAFAKNAAKSSTRYREGIKYDSASLHKVH